MEEILSPVMTLMKAVPMASFAVLLLIWWGSSFLAVAVCFMVVLPNLYLNILEGLKSTDVRMLEMARVFRLPLRNRFFYIYRPALKPFLYSGLKLSLGMCWKSGVAAEVIGTPDFSIGERLYLSKVYLDTAGIFAWTAVVILMSVLFEKAVMWLLERFLRWEPACGKQRSAGNADNHRIIKSDISIKVSDVTKIYGEQTVLDHFSADYIAGETYYLTGPSGSGKTTLLRILAAPLEAGSADLFDLANAAIVELTNPAMTLESVDDAALLGGANRAMLGSELLQFGRAEVVAPGLWRLSHLLRGRAGTRDAMIHDAGEAFVLLDDSAALLLPETLSGWTESGEAVLQWIARGGTAMSEVAVPMAGRALRPLAPVHGRLSPDGAGGATAGWVRRSRVDTGWRDQVDLPVGENREAWRVALAPPVPGIGPWELSSPVLAIAAGELATVPPGTALEVRQVGDFALSPPLFIPLT